MVESDSDSKFPPVDLAEVIRMLTFQQFYEGKDVIYSRTKENSIKVRNSGLVIHQLNLTFMSPPLMEKLLALDFDGYLDGVAQKNHIGPL
jgi:hypothetical protein